MDIKRVWPFVVHRNKSYYDVYVGRPSKYGNPYSHKDGTLAKFKVDTRAEAIQKYEEWVRSQPEMIAMIKRELRGKKLACFCVPRLCHAHVLAWIANFEADES
ncbi:DUF4326 domain-containing protein [Candidatus Pacearchaeota archaeon]|jgi:hypothetical protein|nr:DUF4326 domain-containing protein [Candidatus Pacearchaeota archaeon]